MEETSINIELSPVPKRILKIFKDKSDVLIDSTVSEALKEYNESEVEIYDELFRAGFKMTIKILIPIMEFGAPHLLRDQMLWSADRLPNDKIEMNIVFRNLKIFKNAVNKNLNKEDAAFIIPYIDWMLDYK